MNQQGFEDYSYFAYGNETGTAKSYITAIHMENPHQIDPPFPHVIDPSEFFFSSTNEMQAVRMKNRNSLHSI